MGVQVGIVIGGGNFWRGVKDGEGHIERTRADHMGMLATAMNCMAMADVLPPFPPFFLAVLLGNLPHGQVYFPVHRP